MKDRGAALLTTVIAMLVLSLIAATFFSLSAARARMETSEEKGIRAYYLAEAGIHYAVAYAYERQELAEEIEESIIVENPFGEGYGGHFSITWTEEQEDSSIVVRSTGEYKGVVRKIEAGFIIPIDPSE